jgi:hypothetical protein
MLKQGSPRDTGSERLRVLVAVAALPVLAGYAAIAALLAVVSALATQADFSPDGILLAAGPGWLAAYQVPLTIDGHHLGLLPLGLTIGVGVLLARSAAGAAERLDCRTPHQAVVIVGTMAGAHAVVGVTVAVLANGSMVTADPLASFCLPGLFAAVAAGLGLARRSGVIAAMRPFTDAAAVAGVRAGLLGMAGLLLAGSLVLTVASTFSAPTMHALFEASAPGFGSGIGMLLLCVAYLPNAVLATLGFTVGPGFSLGPVRLSAVDFVGGDVPAMPLLAGLPDAPAGWWPVVFALPVAVGVAVGLRLRGSSPDAFERLRAVGVAGAVVGFSCVVLGALAGGRIGASSGLTLPLGLLSVAAFCWVAVPAALVAWFAGERESRAPDGESGVPDGESGVADGESGVADGESCVPDGELGADDEELEESEEKPEPEGHAESADGEEEPATPANDEPSADGEPAESADSPAESTDSREDEPAGAQDSRAGAQDSREGEPAELEPAAEAEPEEAAEQEADRPAES